MHRLADLLLANETWLMERILAYARRQEYTRYTSTLLEAWRMSISGLTEALCLALREQGSQAPELHPDEDFVSDPVTAFGRSEARLHRERGIGLGMFLGLLKYYRDTYVDLIAEQAPEEEKEQWSRFILRSFDRFEVALCVEWAATEQAEQMDMLQVANRRLTNEKNRYLTLFESSPHPMFFVHEDGLLDNMNLAAAQMLGLGKTSGEMYYAGGHSTLDRKKQGLKPVHDYLPWLEREIAVFSRNKAAMHRFEAKTTFFGSVRDFDVFFARMLDVSGKYAGMIVIVDDITRRKLLEEELNLMATTDALTGAHNRHRFFERGNEELARAKRYGRPLSILMLDIDHFKRINDAHGHAVGDEVLRALSAKCRKMFRLTDVFGRLGGEEFAAVLPETGISVAAPVAERLRQALAELRLPVPDGEIGFTVSIGVAEYQDGQAFAAVLSCADKALYEAKRQGRNRVVKECPEEG